jgi:hypothetical protein
VEDIDGVGLAVGAGVEAGTMALAVGLLDVTLPAAGPHPTRNTASQAAPCAIFTAPIIPKSIVLGPASSVSAGPGRPWHPRR